jgi:hypothetical protein
MKKRNEPQTYANLLLRTTFKTGVPGVLGVPKRYLGCNSMACLRTPRPAMLAALVFPCSRREHLSRCELRPVFQVHMQLNAASNWAF